MKQIRKTLGELFKSQKAEETNNEPPKSDSEKESADKKKDESEDDEESDDDEKDEKEGKKDKKKTPAGADEKKESADQGEESETPDGASFVSLSLDEYNQLFSLASESKQHREANVELKKKAEQWDAYQASIAGNKPAADSTGASSDGKKELNEEQAEMERLRKKHGGLMEGL